MWKLTALTVFALILVAVVPAEAGSSRDYVLTIDGTAYPAGLGETVTIKDANGKSIAIKLEKAPIATYDDELVSFQHKGELGVGSTEIDKSIKQLMMVAATGTLVLVQEYADLNPSSITPLMLEQLTKETLKAGGKLQQEPFTRTLANGRTLNGLKATLTEYNGDVAYFEVLAVGTPDRGILAVSRISGEYVETESAIIDLFWKSLTVKF